MISADLLETTLLMLCDVIDREAARMGRYPQLARAQLELAARQARALLKEGE